jgi:uncharacterized protein
MIIKFIVSNFKSFKEKTEFNMIAGNYKRHDSHVFKSSAGLNLLRTSAIYGSNASGKSNFICALERLQEIVVDGTLDIKDKISVSKFKLDETSMELPTVFEIEFLKKEKRYAYSISIDKGKVLQEWLYLVKGVDEEIVFERTIVDGKTVLNLGEKKKLDAKEKMRIEIYSEELRENQPFILEGKNKKIEKIEEAYSWFEDNLRLLTIGSYFPGLAQTFELKKEYMAYAKQIINSINIGISDMLVDKIPIEDFFGESDITQKKEIFESLNKENHDPMTGYKFSKNNIDYNAFKGENAKIVVAKIVTKHTSRTKDFQFELKEESDGTNRILQLLPAIIKALEENAVMIIDEIESSIHPVIIKELIKLYLDAGNRFNGQIIFSTHECNLLDLDLLRQDEIWFTEKNIYGESVLYSLSDFKPRFDKDIRKGYLEGQFSKIPFLANPLNLKWHELEKKSIR